MKKVNSLPGLLLGLVFIVGAFFLISKSNEASESFKYEKNEIIKVLNFNERLLSVRDWIFSESAWQEKKELFDAAVARSEIHYADALNYGYYLLYLCVAFLLVLCVIYFRRIYYGLTLAVVFIGLALLGQGIMNPILEMAAFKDDMTIKVYVKPKDIPYYEEMVEYIGKVGDYADYFEYIPFVGEELAEGTKDIMKDSQSYLEDNADGNIGFDKVFPGQTYFYYQNKGIFDVISLLWNNDNKVVAGAIGTFSVIIPCIKLFFTLLILLLPVHGMKGFRKGLSYISKWSMADVFVVGTFLSYLSFANMSPGVQMDAKVLFGLYYFGGYVILSIAMGFLLDAAIREKIRFHAQLDSPKA
jgi:hypothetical protein